MGNLTEMRRLLESLRRHLTESRLFRCAGTLGGRCPRNTTMRLRRGGFEPSVNVFADRPGQYYCDDCAAEVESELITKEKARIARESGLTPGEVGEMFPPGQEPPIRRGELGEPGRQLFGWELEARRRRRNRRTGQGELF